MLLVIDAKTGQNGLQQAKIFTEAVEVTGVVLTSPPGKRLRVASPQTAPAAVFAAPQAPLRGWRGADAIQRAPLSPRAIRITSEAGAVVALSPAGPSTRKQAMFTAR